MMGRALALAACFVLLAATPGQAAIDLLGRTSVTFGWTPSANPISYYDVYVACQQGLLPGDFPNNPEITVFGSEQEVTISGSYGESCQIEVDGRDVYGHKTPLSFRSEIVSFQAPVAPDDDFDGDGSADVAMQDPADSSLYVFAGNTLSTGDQLVFQNPEDGNVDPSWTLIGTGNFDGDPVPDYLWSVDGGTTTSFRAGGSQLGDTFEVTSLPADYAALLAIGDFDGNGMDDFFLWRESTGALLGYFMQPGGNPIVANYPSVHGLHWKFIAAGDFNDDGTDDLLWQKSGSGRVTAWLFEDQTRVDTEWSDAMGVDDWTGGAVGNFNNDPGEDLLWHNPVTGENVVWYLDDVRDPDVVSPSTTTASGWSVIADEDLDGDGRGNVVWWESSSSQIEVWSMDEYAPAGFYVE